MPVVSFVGFGLCARLRERNAGKAKMGTLQPTQSEQLSALLSKDDTVDGALKWYAVHVRAGSEEQMATKCREVLNREVAEACFAPKRERYLRLQGNWRMVEDVMFRGYFFVASRDARALARALGNLSFPLSLVGARGQSYPPLSPGAQSWLDATLDAQHVLRASEGVIEDSSLKVLEGPLRGRESYISRIDRHKRMAFVWLSEGEEGFLLRAALNVPKKS